MFRHLPLDRIRQSLDRGWDLDNTTAEENRRRYGTNDIFEKSGNRWLELAKDTFLDPMIWFLFATGMLFLWLGEYTESLVLLLAIIPIGGMDAFLHWRTQVSTQTLSSKLVTYAMVVRHGRECRIPAADLVPGDLMMVQAGDYFPADGIILGAENMQVDESSLTGESVPVLKHALSSLSGDSPSPLIAYEYWGMVGTRVLTGRAVLRVVYTGKETLYGEIVQSVLETHHQKTPLQRALMKLVLTLIFVASGLCLLLAAVRFYQGFGLIDAILSGATLAVAALPDEFPMVFTFFLGVGVYRLAQKHALVRRAVSVENIGRVTTICTDKTGTVTEGRFHIAKACPVDEVSESVLLQYARLAARHESHDPLDMTLLAVPRQDDFRAYTLVKTFPFTEDRKRETAIYQHNGTLTAVTKGAPETLLAMSHLDPQILDNWQHQLSDLARAGYKVLGCARAVISAGNLDEPASDYEWLGLIAFIDPPRKEVYAAIQYCQSHQLHVLMITGDHPETAHTIATEIGLGNGAPNVITAAEAEVILQSRGAVFLRTVHVIARAVPAQKYAIVNALKSLNEVVVVTGDGVNDVPALRAADIGIAMGERGTQSAREAASIVLLDDNFGSIVNAIREGRQLFKNLQLSFKYILMIHIPYVLSATLIPLFGFPLLYYPIQIVWIELFIHPTCMLVFQELPGQASGTDAPSTRGKVSFFTALDWWGIGIVGAYATALVLLAYLFSLKITGDPAAARADAFVAVGLTHIALTIGLSRLRTTISWVVTVASVVMLVGLVQIPVISNYFNMQPPSVFIWVALSTASVVTGALAWWFAN